MLRSILGSLLLLWVGQGMGQNVVNERTAQVIAYWDPGDVRHYDVLRVKEGRKPGRSSFVITFRVLDATDSTYVVECLYSDLKVEAQLPEDERGRELMARLMNAAEGMRVVCTTDETGIPLALVNEQEVAEHVRSVLSHVLELASNATEREQMERAFSAVLNTQVLAQSALEDIGNLLFAFGVEYELGKKESVRTQIPSPLGGQPLSVRQEFTMTALDPGKATAHMSMTQRVDPEGLEEGLDRLMQGMGKEGMSAEDRKEMEKVFRQMKVTDTMEMDIDLIGAWTRHARYVRVVEVKDHRDVDTRTYSLR